MSIRLGRGAIELTFQHAIAEIVFQVASPDHRINLGFVEAFAAACERVTANPEARVLILRSGMDDFWLEPPSDLGRTLSLERWRVASALAAVPQPVVVEVHGTVLNQGLEVALTGDIRITEPAARFGDLRVVNGTFPFDGCTQRLPRLIGPGLTADMLLTGRILSADEALDAGLVTRVAKSRETLGETAHEVAREIAMRGAIASRYAKEAVRSSGDLALRDGVRAEADLSLLLHGTPERVEGLASFREKRPAQMPGAPRKSGQ